MFDHHQKIRHEIKSTGDSKISKEVSKKTQYKEAVGGSFITVHLVACIESNN